MRFAVALPWWGYVAAFAAAVLYAWFTYGSARVEVGTRRLLTALRAFTLLLLVAAVLRPVRVLPPAYSRERVVPILVDVSRSMRIADAEGPARLQRARAAAAALQTALESRFQTEVWSFGDGVVRAELSGLQASASRSDLSGALASVNGFYRGRALGGIVVISDGGDTAPRNADGATVATAPVFTVGVGEPMVTRDREIVSMSAGEPRLADSTVDVHVSAVSTGYGTQPLELTLTANGRPVDVRRVAVTDGAPVHEVFTVSPDASAPTVYGVEVPVAPGETAAENNTRSVLVEPPGRRRRLLLVEGAPGYEHTFLKRALARDTSLDVDSVIRKGQTDDGHPTFFVQAAASRAPALAAGFPDGRAALVSIRRRHLRQCRGGVLHARSTGGHGGVRLGTGRRVARHGRTVIRAAGAVWHGARRGAAGRRVRSSRASRSCPTTRPSDRPRSSSPPTAPTILRRASDRTRTKPGGAGRRCRRWRRSPRSVALGLARRSWPWPQGPAARGHCSPCSATARDAR